MGKIDGYIDSSSGDFVVTDLPDDFDFDTELDKIYSGKDQDIDNDSITGTSIIDIDNDKESMADKLVRELDDPDGRRFYEMIVTKTTTQQIESALSYAKTNGKKPAALFNTLIRRNINV